MYSDNSKNPENFEVDPLRKSEEMRELGPMEGDFAESMSGDDVPRFSGEDFNVKSEGEYGIANEENQYYGETTSVEESDDEQKANSDYNDGLADATAILNYGLNAAAREKGVEVVIQGIKTFDASNSEHPLFDLYKHLGIDTKKEREDMRDEARASKSNEAVFKEQSGMPKTSRKSEEGALKAIKDMKELILEVEGADPRYESLRQGARNAGMGYFEYAVKGFGVRGLTELFTVLATQKEMGDTAGVSGQSENSDDTETGEQAEKSEDVEVEEQVDNKDELETEEQAENGGDIEVEGQENQSENIEENEEERKKKELEREMKKTIGEQQDV